MVPISMKKPVWLTLVCVADLTMGLFLMVVITAPGFAPELRERVAHRGLTGFIFAIAATNIFGPIAALWYHCRASERSGQRMTGENE